MPSAADRILTRIDEAGGALRFDRFMDESLYGDDGFYTSGRGRAGRRGDYITSPEIGPLFGTVLARALDTWWDDMGCPEGFTVVDAGAGPGTLARSVLAAEPACLVGRPEAYVAVEISAAQRLLHPPEVTSTDRLPDGSITGVVVANELLDNLPFRLLVHDGTWREAWVTHGGAGFLEVLRPVGSETIEHLGLPSSPPHGARVPWQQAAGEWVADVVARLRGRLVVIDYAVNSTAELARRNWREWLRTFAGHDKGEHYLNRVGEQDLTCDVCLDQLRRRLGEPALVRTQSEFLQRWGIDELVEEGRRVWTERASRPDLEALRMRSRIGEAEALCDSHGLGAFTVIEFHGAL